ncbi:unnamed protein product [Cyclocybe aegerita]|uniref:AIG1-type G domain-containing protein n=1 Tax=Cyclocybe aegerita TaxID=1973307 RepID=A0A8S0VR54_CYCAE|nr:unnamed protein product [Cyclocybe aegerita]
MGQPPLHAEKFHIQGGDIVIPVLGPTGSGKSTFINHLLGTESMEVGHQTTSCTTEPCPGIIIPIPNFPNLRDRRLVILDTPGFDDTYTKDPVIVKNIADWLSQYRRKGASIGGVLYLHDISTRRFTSTPNKNLHTLCHICGDASLKRTIMVTTNWDSITNNVLSEREEEMKARHWNGIIEKGACVRRFLLGSSESAWDIINVLLRRADGPPGVLQIQEEMVDRGIGFQNTEAGGNLLRVAEKKREQERQQEKTFKKKSLCVVQ